MAATTFDVTVEMVKADLPFDPRSIGASTRVSTSDIEGWIDRAGGRFASALAKNGLATSGLSDDDLGIVQEGVIQFCVARALQALNFPDGDYRAAQSNYEARLGEIEARRSTLTAGTGRTPGSNLDRSNPARRSARFNRDRSW